MKHLKNGMVLRVTITPTATGGQDYIQIMSLDQVSVNIVLIADKIEVKDTRPSPRK